MDHSLLTWAIFAAIVITVLILDLGVMHRKTAEVSAKDSLLTTGFYMLVAAAFGTWVWFEMGPQAGKEFFTGYLVEFSLSMDNVFVISMIFSYLLIPRRYQHRVLFWGILGAIFFRAIMIGAGAYLVAQFAWVLYVFGAFLLLTGIKMWFSAGEEADLSQNKVLLYLKRHLPLTPDVRDESFIVRQNDPRSGKTTRTLVTPLLLALILVELADLLFAVDSVPAIFAITQDPYIVYTSNIFAILGLRALYFSIAAMIHRFAYLKYALALVLVFIGSKIFIVHYVHMPALLSLGITFSILAGGILYSLWRTRKDA